MLRENYLTTININQKSRKWFDKLKKYSKKDRINNFRNIALLIIDMQNFFLDNTSHAYIPSAKAIIPNIKRIIATFRNHNLPVIFTRYSLDPKEEGMMTKWWDDRVIEGSESSKIIKELEPLNNDVIIRKKKYSAFQGTSLKAILKSKSIKNVVIAGVMTHLCCESTSRDAFMHNFNVYFVIDATASINEDLHLSSLKTLSHGFVNPISTSVLIKKIST